MLVGIAAAPSRLWKDDSHDLRRRPGRWPLVVRVVDELLRSPVDEIFTVTGKDGAEITEALAGRRVQFIANPDLEGDMLSSVCCGLRALPESCHAALVAFGDQPRLTAGLVAKLVSAFHQGGRNIIVPVHGQRRGHPLLFAARFCGEILHRFDGLGLRGLLDAYPDEITEVAVETAHELEDMDTPADYLRLTGETRAS